MEGTARAPRLARASVPSCGRSFQREGLAVKETDPCPGEVWGGAGQER